MNPISAPSQPSKNPRLNVAAAAVVTIGLALTGGNVYLVNKTGHLEDQVKDLRSAYRTELIGLQREASARSMDQTKALAELREQLEQTGVRTTQVATQAATQASSAARRYSDQLAKKLALQEKQTQEQQRLLAEQLGEITQAASQTDQKVTGVATDVTLVKTEVAQAKSDLDKTIGDLRAVRGDLGIQSGLIATNGKELQALRSLGERNYFEFQLTKTNAPQKIGDVAVQVKRLDSKRNRYTIELIADDRKMEKKDRSVNEPVQFYMAKARIPYEIVVNEVRKDRIVGYLATPKVREMR